MIRAPESFNVVEKKTSDSSAPVFDPRMSLSSVATISSFTIFAQRKLIAANCAGQM